LALELLWAKMAGKGILVWDWEGFGVADETAEVKLLFQLEAPLVGKQRLRHWDRIRM
jgi:hypothetical protein